MQIWFSEVILMNEWVIDLSCTSLLICVNFSLVYLVDQNMGK